MHPPLCRSDAGATPGSSLTTCRALGPPAGTSGARGPLRSDSLPPDRLHLGRWTPQAAHEDVGGPLSVPESLLMVHRFFKGDITQRLRPSLLRWAGRPGHLTERHRPYRSEEHTSELQ